MMKQKIILSENTLKQIIKESIKEVLIESDSNQEFGNTCNKLFELFDDVVGGETLKEVLFSMGDIIFDKENDDDFQMVWKYNKGSMLNLLYHMVNYDLIDIFSKKGEINIENSNNPIMAKLIKPYCTSDMIKRVAMSF